MAEGDDKRARLEAERALVRRCLVGEEDAFGELVLRYQQLVFNLAFRFMGNRQEAEDLSQEVFMKVFGSLRTFRRASTLKTWIYRITINMALNRLKWLQRRQRSRQVSIDRGADAELPPMSESLPDGSPGPESVLRGAEIGRRLQEALDELSRHQKAVLILRDVEGLSYDEIAATLKINIGTVKSRLARGRANVQERLKDLL